MGNRQARVDERTMTQWTVLIENKARRELKSIDKPIRLKIIALIDSLQTGNPRIRGKSLTADKAGLWRYRVMDYRVIALIEDHHITITVVRVGHRSKVYD
jgi:mRNA interferase RelE/StbE